jgi:hypothetical protein
MLQERVKGGAVESREEELEIVSIDSVGDESMDVDMDQERGVESSAISSRHSTNKRGRRICYHHRFYDVRHTNSNFTVKY